MYFRDSTALLPAHLHKLWIALEAGSGIVPQHDYDPNSYCRTGASAYNGCSGDSNPGAWWNVSADPYIEGEASPLAAFMTQRALNRLALRTKLNISSGGGVGGGKGGHGEVYTAYVGYNCYDGHGGREIDSTPMSHLSVEQCEEKCNGDSECDCVTTTATEGAAGDCWRRADCNPARFEHDDASRRFSTYVRKTPPKPPPKQAGGALVYLKHDSMGPHGDAALMVFNPGAAQNLTIDLSLLPPELLSGGVVPHDLFAPNHSLSTPPPLSPSWVVEMGRAEVKAFGGFELGVFAPRRGKKKECRPDDGYQRRASGDTLQACFLECRRDPKCENVAIDFVDIVWMEKPPPVACTLLGAVADPSTACSEGTGTLVKRLSGSRRCAHRWGKPAGIKKDEC
jgi:hypothetical protein